MKEKYIGSIHSYQSTNWSKPIAWWSEPVSPPFWTAITHWSNHWLCPLVSMHRGLSDSIHLFCPYTLCPWPFPRWPVSHTLGGANEICSTNFTLYWLISLRLSWLLLSSLILSVLWQSPSLPLPLQPWHRANVLLRLFRNKTKALLRPTGPWFDRLISNSSTVFVSSQWSYEPPLSWA